MTAKQSQLKDLERRLAEATGPDRELDRDVMSACGFKVYPLDAPSKETLGDAWAVTASLDAAVSLTERVLPGWHIAHIGQHDDKTWNAELRRGYLTSYDKVALTIERNATPALALCLACVRALIAQGEK